MKRICLIILVMLPLKVVFAQSKALTEKDYAKAPYWIAMVNDTTTNYFEAEKAFKVYFAHHHKPEGENEDIGEHAKREKRPSKKELRKIEKDNRMRMDIKRYQHWHAMMQPYVQEDGSILTPTQRLQIHQQILNNGK